MSRLQDLRAALQSDDVPMKPGGVRRSVYEQAQPAPAMQKLPEPDTRTVPLQEEVQKVSSLLSYYISTAGVFARLSGDMLTQNLLVVSHGLPEDVRMVSLESLMWIAGHFGELVSALILNHGDIRSETVDALSLELGLLRLDRDSRMAAHDRTGHPFGPDSHCMELGLTEFTPDTQLAVAGRITESIRSLSGTKLADAVDGALASYGQEDADDMGAILSNPVYLLIVCNYNAGFMAKLADILADLRSAYSI